jgi:hypothetical protein
MIEYTTYSINDDVFNYFLHLNNIKLINNFIMNKNIPSFNTLIQYVVYTYVNNSTFNNIIFKNLVNYRNLYRDDCLELYKIIELIDFPENKKNKLRKIKRDINKLKKLNL